MNEERSIVWTLFLSTAMKQSKSAEMNKTGVCSYFFCLWVHPILGLVFRSFLANLILPVATVFWLLLRILVLSIDQQVYWWLLISLVIFIAIFRVVSRPETVQPYQPLDSNQLLDSVHHWRTSILANAKEGGENNTLRRDLMWLLTSMYSSRKQGSAHYEIKEALEQHQILYPETIHAFLFSNAGKSRQNFLHNPVRIPGPSIHQTGNPKKIRRWSGREAAEYYRAIDEVLAFMETTLEIKYDDDPIGPRND
jgi:hypothetical protein